MNRLPGLQLALSSTAIAVLLAVSLAGCTVTNSGETASPAPASPTASGDDLIARGEYLVRTNACNDCHTPGYGERGGEVPTSEWLVGVPLGFNGPWGTTYPANLRLKAAEYDEAGWLKYTGELHTRPIMPDYALRAMSAEDRRAIYHFITSLGPAGNKAPDYLPPGQTPPAPYFQLVLPAGPAPTEAAPTGAAATGT